MSPFCRTSEAFNRIATFFAIGVAGVIFCAVMTGKGQRPGRATIDPIPATVETIGNGWARFDQPDYRVRWDRPEAVKSMTIYDPGAGLNVNVHGFSVIMNEGKQDQFRIDFPTEAEAVGFVDFILANDGRGDDQVAPQTRYPKPAEEP